MEKHQKRQLSGKQAKFANCQQPMTPNSQKFLAELASLGDVESRAIKLKPGSKLFWQNGSADRLYLILDGCFKESYVDPTGFESVVEFYYCNEFIGVESLGEPAYENTAEAITSAWVSAIHCPDLKKNLLGKGPQLEHYVWGLIGDAITAARRRIFIRRLNSAEEKLATFLLVQCKRFGRVVPAPVHMPMARQDLASYLGMSPETISRLFTRFEAGGLIRSTDKQVEVFDYRGLAALLHRDKHRLSPGGLRPSGGLTAW